MLADVYSFSYTTYNNQSSFSNSSSGAYFFGPDYSEFTGYDWYFDGSQFIYGAVDGNGNGCADPYAAPDTEEPITSPIESPSPVPIPAALWLFGASLVGLIMIGRRKMKGV